MNKASSGKSVFPKHFHSFFHRGLYSLAAVSVVLLLGTAGIHWLEGFSWVDSFYFTSMIATGQGPSPLNIPETSAGKLFTCLLAFISVGSMLASLGFLFGPFFGRLWHMGISKVEDEIQHLKHEKK